MVNGMEKRDTESFRLDGAFLPLDTRVARQEGNGPELG